MLIPWLENIILSAARDLSNNNKALYKFDEKIAETLRKLPIQEWEADRWFRGLKLNLIKMNDYFFRVGAGKNSAFSIFVRNEKGLNVGLKRESLTQMATYVTLITDYGYPKSQTAFESQWMDVVVYRHDRAVIYAENKASEKVLLKLCDRLIHDFQNGVPAPIQLPDGSVKKPEDAVMKAQHLMNYRPDYFWAVSPTVRQAYQVKFLEDGLTLNAIDDVPAAHQLTVQQRKEVVPF